MPLFVFKCSKHGEFEEFLVPRVKDQLPYPETEACPKCLAASKRVVITKGKNV